MTQLTSRLAIPDHECHVTAVRAQGAGGQNVNKVSSAVHLRFDIRASSLPADVKERLLSFKDRRITRDGAIVIKAQRFRSLEQNREDAFRRLAELVRGAAARPRPRKPTKPGAGSRRRRLEDKVRRGQLKALRRKVLE